MPITQTTDYVFGYGSLIERLSRTHTVPLAQVAAPVIVQNVAQCPVPVHLPRAWKIDGALSQHIPDLVAQIQLEPAKWDK